MLEILTLASQLYQPPRIDSQAALYDALSSPKVADVSRSPRHLEQRLQAQAGNARTLSFDGVKAILSRYVLGSRE